MPVSRVIDHCKLQNHDNEINHVNLFRTIHQRRGLRAK